MNRASIAVVSLLLTMSFPGIVPAAEAHHETFTQWWDLPSSPYECVGDEAGFTPNLVSNLPFNTTFGTLAFSGTNGLAFTELLFAPPGGNAANWKLSHSGERYQFVYSAENRCKAYYTEGGNLYSIDFPKMPDGSSIFQDFWVYVSNHIWIGHTVSDHYRYDAAGFHHIGNSYGNNYNLYGTSIALTFDDAYADLQTNNKCYLGSPPYGSTAYYVVNGVQTKISGPSCPKGVSVVNRDYVYVLKMNQVYKDGLPTCAVANGVTIDDRYFSPGSGCMIDAAGLHPQPPSIYNFTTEGGINLTLLHDDASTVGSYPRFAYGAPLQGSFYYNVNGDYTPMMRALYNNANPRSMPQLANLNEIINVFSIGDDSKTPFNGGIGNPEAIALNADGQHIARTIEQRDPAGNRSKLISHNRIQAIGPNVLIDGNPQPVQYLGNGACSYDYKTNNTYIGLGYGRTAIANASAPLDCSVYTGRDLEWIGPDLEVYRLNQTTTCTITRLAHPSPVVQQSNFAPALCGNIRAIYPTTNGAYYLINAANTVYYYDGLTATQLLQLPTSQYFSIGGSGPNYVLGVKIDAAGTQTGKARLGTGQGGYAYTYYVLNGSTAAPTSHDFSYYNVNGFDGQDTIYYTQLFSLSALQTEVLLNSISTTGTKQELGVFCKTYTSPAHNMFLNHKDARGYFDVRAGTAPTPFFGCYSPPNFAAEAGPGGRQITLTWQEPINPTFPSITGYKLYRGLNSNSMSLVTQGGCANLAAVLACTDTDPTLTDDTMYTYRATAISSAGESRPSNTASAKTLIAPSPVLDGFTVTDYQSESAAGTTPFGGSPLKPSLPSGTETATVNFAVGELAATFPLLGNSNDVGSDVSFDLTYRSIGNSNGNPALSWGWDANWLQRLEANGTDYIHHTGDGRTHRYASSSSYEGPPGSYTKLVFASAKLELQDRAGNRRVFDPAQSLRLTDVHDSTGNHWTLSYPSTTSTTLTDPLGRTTTLTYAHREGNPFYDTFGQPLLVNVTDFAGRTALIEYSPLSGRLAAIKIPGASAGAFSTTRFGYNAAGHLNEIQDPLGNKYLYTAFDEAGRVVTQRENGQLAFTFEYNHTQGLTKVKDGNTNWVDWRFLPSSASTPRVVPVSKVEYTRGLRATDPANYTTTYTHNAQDEITLITYLAGNSVAYTYDEASSSYYSRGNLLQETSSPGLVRTLGDEAHYQASITTQYQYDSTYNVVTKSIDPRGTDAAYLPPNGGVQSATRYTTRIIYDFEEATLGDLNGDGITTQTARNPVRIEHATVNPAGLPHSAFTAAYGNQVRVENFAWNSQGQLVKHEDGLGIEETRTYYTSGASKGYLQSVTQDSGGLALTTTYAYNAFGAVTSITDPNGHTRTFDVDQRGRVTQETGPNLGAASIHTKWTYDANDNVVKVEQETNPGSGTFTVKTYTYDALDRVTKETVYANRSATITAALTGQGTPPGAVYSTLYEYDGSGNVKKITGGAGGVETRSYDERNLLLTQSGPAGGTYAYDANGNLASHTDPRGKLTTYQFDGYDRPSVRLDPAGNASVTGNVFVQNYDSASNVVHERGFAGSVTGPILYDRALFHDEANQLYRVDDWHDVPIGNLKALTTGTLTPVDNWVTTLHEFDARGQEVRTINDNNHAVTTLYDAVGRVKKVTDPLGNTIESTFDGDGNILTRTMKDSSGAGACPQVCTTSYAYDAENRLTLVTNPDATTRQSFYDGRGNVVKTIDELGNQVEEFYDNADRPWVQRHWLGATSIDATTHWDGEDRTTKKCTAGNQCTTYTYKAATKLLASETPPVGASVTHSYDLSGNRIQSLYANAKKLQMGYDALDRRTSVVVSGMPASSGTTHQNFTYDGMNRVVQATDNGIAKLGSDVLTTLPQIVATQDRDTLGRVVAESQINSLLTVRHALDGLGNVASSAYPSPDGRLVSRSYDANERLDRVWDTKGLVADYAYQGGRVTEKAFGGPAVATAPVARTTLQYDGMQRPNGIQHKDAAGTVLIDLTTRFDAVGNRVAQKLQGSGVTDRFSQLYDLDGLYRTEGWKQGPINAALDAIAVPAQQSTWPTMDGANNWLTWDPGTGPCTRTTGTTGSPAVRQVKDLSCPAAKTYTYDRNGNLASDGTYTYKWDAFNRLIRVNDATGKLVVGYGYDAFDRRVVKVFPNNAPAVGTTQPAGESWYTYSGPHVVQESQLFGSILPTTVPPTAPGIHVVRQWVYGPNVDEVLAMDWDTTGDGITIGPGDARYSYAYDSGANVIGLLSETGHMVEGYAYQPYGQPTVLVPASGAADVKWDGTDTISTGTYGSSPTLAPYSPSGNLWFFTGRQYDPEIGTYNYRAREYHPGLGQFMSMDPIGAWGDPMNLGNPYAYVGNNPSSFRDPSGHYAGVDDAIACGGGAVVAAGIRGAMDLWHGKASSWQSYAGEVAGGCAGGVATLYTGPIGGGAAYGAVSSSTRYGLEVASGDRDGSLGGFGKTVGTETAYGAAGGALGFGVGKVASRALSEASSPALNRFGAIVEDGLHAQKGPLARTRVFYSGPGAEGAAQTFAQSNHGMLVEDTSLGKAASRILQSEGKWTPAFDAKARLASVEFAARARGQVPVFHGDTVTIGRIWQQEYGVLTNNPRVSGLDFYDVHGGRFP